MPFGQAWIGFRQVPGIWCIAFQGPFFRPETGAGPASLGLMVLFLDFDGVLHPQEHGGNLFCRRQLLWDILRAHPEVRVVFSTAWREAHPLADLVAFATADGGEDLAPRFIGVTPVHPFDPVEPRRHRERECLAWLAANRPGGPWLALDDVQEWFSCPQFYLVDCETGLTPQDVASILERLARHCSDTA